MAREHRNMVLSFFVLKGQYNIVEIRNRYFPKNSYYAYISIIFCILTVINIRNGAEKDAAF